MQSQQQKTQQQQQQQLQQQRWNAPLSVSSSSSPSSRFSSPGAPRAAAAAPRQKRAPTPVPRSEATLRPDVAQQQMSSAAPVGASSSSATAAAPPPSSSSSSLSDSARASLLGNGDNPTVRDLLLEKQIALRQYTPGRHVRGLCPACQGGSTRELSFDVDIASDGQSALWNCHRGTCGFSGKVDVEREMRRRRTAGSNVEDGGGGGSSSSSRSSGSGPSAEVATVVASTPTSEFFPFSFSALDYTPQCALKETLFRSSATTFAPRLLLRCAVWGE